MKTLLVACFGVAVLAAGGVAWKEMATARQIKTASAALERENARFLVAVAQATTRLARAERELAAVQASAAATVAKDEGKPVVVKPEGSFDPVAEYQRLQKRERDPKVQAVRLALVQARDRMRYGPLFRRLGLTAEQIERFNRINADRLERRWDLREVASDASTGGAVPADLEASVEKLRALVEAECEASCQTLLGESGYREFREYQRSLAPREIVSDIAGAAVLAGVPFSASQAEQLTQILANASGDYRAGKPASDRTIDWTLADEQARGVLTGDQWELFRTIDPLGSANSRFRGAYVQRLLEGITQAEREREKTAAAAETPGG